MHKLNSRLMLAAVLSAALVAGCGGDGSAAPPIVAPVPTPTPTPVADISTSVSDLFAFVSALIAGTSDSSDPIDINPLTLATDNAASPTPLN
ncbi:MAG: hypothetical protein V4772_17470 [Pseudomonadota bacterium]